MIAHYQESLDFFSHFEFFSPIDIIFALISIVCPVLLIFFAFMGYDVFVWVLLWLALQSSIYARYLRREDRIFSRALSYCQVVHTLKKLNDKGIFLPQDETLIKPMTHRALKYTYIYRFCATIEKYDVYYLMELLKCFLSLPIFQCFLLIKHRDILQADYLRIYEYVGIVDLAVSVLSLRNDYDTCIPLLSKQPQVSFQAGYHPVFENPVKNSFTINESCMITGSNASGKSTFLKTVGLNLLLAQSIHTCFADEITYYPFHLCTSIHIKDDINSGESYYVKEIKILKAIVDEVKTKHCFVLVDEILRGTNEYERMKIARAILDYLYQSDALVIVTTHDLRLVNDFMDIPQYCFLDYVKDHQLYWDYKIHEGICRVGNAIALLEACEMDETILENIRKVG